MESIKKRQLKKQILNLPEKLEAICLVTQTKSLKELSEKTKVASKTLNNWATGRVVPYQKTFHKFCDAVKVEPHIMRMDLIDFCSQLGIKFKFDPDHLYSAIIKSRPVREDSILSIIRSAQPSDIIRQIFEDKFRGYWQALHYWESLPSDKIKEDNDKKKTKYIFRNLLHFYKYQEKTNTILFNFASARQEKVKWNYRGHMVVAQNKLYFILETTIKAEVEVILITTNKPSQNYNRIRGLILASIPTREEDGIISKPAVARILLQKIDDDEEFSSVEPLDQVGIYPEKYFKNDEDDILSILVNEPDPQIGILFPKYGRP